MKMLQSRGFSLLELTVSVAILAILGVLIAQVSGAIQATTSISNRLVDAAAQARLAYDRIWMDLNERVKTYDADFSSKNHAAPTSAIDLGTRDIIRMVSRVRSQDSVGVNRNLSIVGYDVAPHVANGDRPCLLRAAHAINWTSTGFMGLNEDGYPPKLLRYIGEPVMPILAAGLSPISSDFDVLAPGVIRMVVGFQLFPYYDSKTKLVGETAQVDTNGQIRYNPPAWGEDAPDSYYADLSQVSSILVGLVVMDLNSLKLLTPSQVDSLSSEFVTPTSGTALKTWMTDTNNLTNFSDALPAPARQSLRVYQRAFPINPYRSDLL